MNQTNRVVVIDNHILSTYEACKRKGYYRDVLELVPNERGPALGFGITLHAAREAYIREALKSPAATVLDQSFAVEAGLVALRETWAKEMPEEYKDPAKFLDKRSLSNAEKLFRGYIAKYGPQDYVPMYVEVPFTVGLGVSLDGWEVVWSGIIDDLCRFDGGLYVVDLKTSSWPLGSTFFRNFRLSQQLMGYVFAARQIVSPDVIGAMIHGLWVHAEPIRKTTKTVPIDDYYKVDMYIWTDSQLEEWRTSVLSKVDEMQRAKLTEDFPMNLGQACSVYGKCSYQDLCLGSPEVRDRLIQLGYRHEKWDPIKQTEDLTTEEAA